ncbi:MAG: 2Fe-2S iron-sulfur cluster-binding protein [Chloroflexota bacterium]
MARIKVDGTKEITAAEGQRLVLALEDAGIDILHRCGGNAKCTTCRVVVEAGDAGEMLPRERNRLAEEDDLEPNARLSCQILVHDDLAVRVLRRLSTSGLSDAGPRPLDELPPQDPA